MDLLHTEPKTLRYLFLTTKDNKVYIYFCNNSEFELEDTTKTIIENGYILGISNIDDSQTESYTGPNNESEINAMNVRMYTYVKTRAVVPTMVYINNASYSYKILLESNTFYQMATVAHNFTFDLGESGFRLGDYEYKDISSVKINSGTLILESSCTFTCDKLTIITATFDVYNKSTGNFALNIMCPSVSINGLKQYSTFKLSILNPSVTDTDTKCSIQSITLYGEESLSTDYTVERIYIRGYNKCNIGVVDVGNDVQYGTILKFEFINKLNIGKITRNINRILQGSMIIFGSVATIRLHDINITIAEKNSMVDNTKLLYFTPITTELTRSIKIFDSTITNNSSQKINLISLNSSTIEKIYFSGCTINDYVTLLDINSSSIINKLYLNKCNFSSDSNDFELNYINRINISDSTLYYKYNNISIKSINRIDISKGIWKFKDLSISNDVIVKNTISETEMYGDSLLINNTNFGNSDYTDNVCFFDNAKLEVDSITITGDKTTWSNTYIKSKEININTVQSITATNITLKSVNNLCNFNCNCSISGSILLYPESNDEKININISDKEKFLNLNQLEVIDLSSEYCPIITFNTNRPIKINLTNIIASFVYASFTNDTINTEDENYSLDADSTFVVEISDTTCGVINNSPKVTALTKSTDSFNRTIYTCSVIENE